MYVCEHNSLLICEYRLLNPWPLVCLSEYLMHIPAGCYSGSFYMQHTKGVCCPRGLNYVLLYAKNSAKMIQPRMRY